MDIVCPHCETSYRVTPESLGQKGRSVRCVNCNNVWFAEPPQPVFQADEPSLAAAAPSMIRPALDDVVEIGLTASSRPVWDQPLDETDIFNKTKEPGFDTGAPHNTGFPDGPRMQAGPSIVPPLDPKSDFNGGQDIESLAARRTAQRQMARRRFGFKPSLPVAICAMLAVIGGLVVARHQVVRILPQTASLYAAIGLPVNLRGLVFDNIKTVRETEDGQTMLVVEGNIVSTAGRLTEVPRLRFGVIDSAGKEIYAWTARPNRALLPPGEILNFRSRLASPPADAISVTVRFFNRRDAQTELM
ncbi:MJ0042-type zinc finger domain-containing protein [Pseudorhodoplanes sinuspersici]|uniref:Uncharacterized protein n=1 Tax=Pseudorhodoplanes sinuspersici TaxID=1235591 RepID=A0A1W6ZSM8_9HYPH|nr:MJ0042-type zinc finger domain-containing protein [Pseudorhodoplanes sinuspersici]ARP99744.1 hypothetical protein CAK95_12090 [Pseudorhodoplanes sinuspersici]RKE70734.1 putative Zn finger-like uncharacterized protein [Pseudorhodoplanes sinuspersici]